MAKRSFLSLALLGFMSTISADAAENAPAGPWSFGPITVEQAWARVVPGNAKTGAVYLIIHNKSNADDHLLAVESAAARSAAIHESRQENGVAIMQPIPGGLEMPSHGEIVMRPGGYHIMLAGVSGALKPGNTLPVQIILRDAGTFDLDVPILPLTAGSPSMKHAGHGSW